MPEAVRRFVEELPRWKLPLLKGFLEERLCREQLAAAAPPAAPPPDEAPLTTKAAGARLGVSEWEVRAMIARRELEAYRRRPDRGSWHILPAAIRRYQAARLRTRGDFWHTPPDDINGRESPPPPAALDAAPARRRPQRDRPDGEPLGTRRARHHAAGRDRPYAPGAAAWSGPTPPEPKG
jgi:hypothetical protein